MRRSQCCRVDTFAGIREALSWEGGTLGKVVKGLVVFGVIGDGVGGSCSSIW